MMSKDTEQTPLLHDTRFSSFSSCANGSVHYHDDANDLFYDVTERTSSSASVTHHATYDVIVRTSSSASTSQYAFYDPAEQRDGTDGDIFYDVKERALSSLSMARNYNIADNEGGDQNKTAFFATGTDEAESLAESSSTSQYGSLYRNIQEIIDCGNGTRHLNITSTQDCTATVANSTPREVQKSSTNTESKGKSKSRDADLSYSPNTAQLVSTLILILYGIALVPSVSLISQYLTFRWRLETGLNGTSQANRSFCSGHANNSIIDSFEDQISAKVSTVTTYYNYVTSAVSIVICLFLGAYADIIGRRIIILFPAFSAVLHFIIIICVMRFDLDTNYFYASSTVIGMGGSFYAMLIGVFTVTSDVNDAKSNRVIWLALQMCVTSVTLALGNIGLGYVIKYIGFYQAAIMLEIFAITTFLVALFFMPETLPKDRKSSAKKVPRNPFKTIAKAFKIYTSEGTVRNRKCLWLCLVIFFFAVIPDLQLYSLDTIFQLHKPLCWDSTQIGYYGAIQTGGKKLAGTLLLKLLQMKGWIKVETLAMVVCLFQAGSMVMQALLKHSWQMYIVPVVGTPSIITIPVIRGIMSFLVGRQNLGALFASIACMETICTMAASTSINRVYTATVDYMPGAVYFLLAGFAVVTFVLFIPFFYIYDDPTKKSKISKNVQSAKSHVINASEE